METRLLELVGLIYDSAQDRSRWPAFLARYAATLGCHIAQLELIAPDSRASVSVSHGLNGHELKDFAHYSQVDPWIPLLLQAKPGAVGLSHEHVSMADYLKSEYYDGFGRRIDQCYGLAGAVLKSSNTLCAIGAVRHQGGGPCTEEDRTLLEVLMPHLARSLRMHSEFAKLDATAVSLLESLDRLARGMIILDTAGRVVRVNRVAEKMAAQNDGLHLSSEGLRASLPSESSLLQKWIHEAAQTAFGNGLSSGGTMTISRPSLRLPWVAVVSPHKSSWGDGFTSVLLIDPEESPIPSAEIVAKVFGFTPSETRIALMLAQGIRLEDAAAQLSITINTARTHTRRMLEKSGVRRQTDLVLVLNKLSVG